MSFEKIDKNTECEYKSLVIFKLFADTFQNKSLSGFKKQNKTKPNKTKHQNKQLNTIILVFVIYHLDWLISQYKYNEYTTA